MSPTVRGVAEQSPYELGMLRLAESGLNGADAKLLGLKFLTAKQTAALGAGFKDRPSIQIPYFNAKGKATGFYRLRYLGKPSGLEGLVLKPQRYAQAPGTSSELYLRPKIPWEKVAVQPTMPVFLTEGEIKAAAACAVGILTIGLGGVYSWRSAKNGVLLLPALEAFDWKARPTYLAFDSDLRTNPQVLRALLALSTTLAHRGALIYMVELPDGRNGQKQGLDDFLLHYKSPEAKTKALNALADKAQPFSESEELWRFNTEVAFVKNPGFIVVLNSGRTMSYGDFVNAHYSNRFYTEHSIDKAGNRTTAMKPLAPAWLKWKCRAELECMAYEPGMERITPDHAYNGWKGWGCDPKRGDVSLWKQLLDYMFNNDTAARKWFEQWCAWPIQHPGDKMYTAAVIWGVMGGTGKSLIGYSLKEIYGENAFEVDERELSSNFNEWAANKQFIMGDDAAGSEHKRGTADGLKFMITRQMLSINKKFQPTYTVRDCINYYMNSNHPDAFIIEDADRRYFVHEAPPTPKPQEFYQAYDTWRKSGELGPALFYHLLNVDLTGFDPRARAPETLAKLAMMRDSKSDIGIWVQQLREDPDSILRIGEVQINLDLFTTKRLLALYDSEGKGRVTANGLGREMKRAGFRQVFDGKVIRVGSKNVDRYYAVRNTEKWLKASLKEIQAHLNAGAAPAEKLKKY